MWLVEGYIAFIWEFDLNQMCSGLEREMANKSFWVVV
jgi:hypothetical protein